MVSSQKIRTQVVNGQRSDFVALSIRMKETLERFFPDNVTSDNQTRRRGQLLYYMWQTIEDELDNTCPSWFSANYKGRGLAGVMVASGMAPELTRDFLPPPHPAPSADPTYLSELALAFDGALTKGAGIQWWHYYSYVDDIIGIGRTANFGTDPTPGHSMIFHRYAEENQMRVLYALDQNGYSRIPLYVRPGLGWRWHWSSTGSNPQPMDVWFGSNWE